jgi:seryl-tRNA synthetase
MHDLKLWRDHADALDAALGRRRNPPIARQLLERDRALRALQTEHQEQQARRNALSKEIGRIRAQGGDAAAAIAEVARL